MHITAAACHTIIYIPKVLILMALVFDVDSTVYALAIIKRWAVQWNTAPICSWHDMSETEHTAIRDAQCLFPELISLGLLHKTKECLRATTTFMSTNATACSLAPPREASQATH